MSKLRLGLVGCGHISKKHIEAVNENSDFYEFVAACDKSENILKSLQEEFSIATYADMETMFAQNELDVVSLCTPSGLHPEQAALAAQHGVHVISEKPMALTSVDARRMIDAFSETDAKLFPVKQIRYNPSLQYLKNDILDQELFGDIYHVNLNVYWTRPQDYFDVAPWRGTKAMDGGMLLNQMIHFVDLFEWLLGPIKTVSGLSKTMARKVETEDMVVANMEWENGALGSFNATILTYPKNLETSLTILGEKGTFRLAGKSLNEILVCEFEQSPPAMVDQADSKSWHGQLYADIAKELLHGVKVSITSDSALRDIEIIESIYA